MAQQFNLTAQINLQSPKNVGKVVSDIRRQLQGSGLNTVNIKVKADARSMAQTNRQLQNVSKSSRAAAKDIGTLNRNLQEATRRFGVITLATGTLLSFVTGLKNSTKAAIEFERELIKISQVTGKSVQQLQSLTKEVTRLSTAFGVSSADLLNVSRTLAQAGFNAEKTRKSLDILAKTTLAATFDNIQDTTEGAIALLRQFGEEAKSAGGDVAFLEKSLSAINSVSKKFAVESGDLITVIRRVGGVFSSAGGSINELIALFTSVRATTRESAETIATGLRTIFTRIQRTETIDQLKALNIQLQDSQGQFVGAFEAVKRLSVGLSSLNPRDFRFSEIVESLGGFRQIGKVIPLIQQFSVAQQALTVAQGASGSVAKDAATAQQGLGVQIQKVKEEFAALIRKFSDSGPFNSIATGALKVATAMIKVAEAVEPLLPLLLTMFGLKLGRSLAPGLASLAGIGRGRGGTGTGGFSRFATGGVVPGSGNRDTVPAMLTPGEFVIKKSSVKKLGTDKLHQMNNNRFSGGNDKRGVKRGQGEDKKRGRFKVLPSGGQTHFAHLDKMGQPSRDFQNLLKKKDPNIKAKAIYSNFGIDIPGTWNMDWGQQRNGSFIKDNEGATKSALASFVKERDIFKSLRKRKKVYKFRGEGSEQAQDIISDKPKMREVRNSFAAKIRTSPINNFDVDPDVIRADIGGMLLKSFKDVPGVQSTKIIPFMKQASAYRLQGDSNRRSVAGEGIKEDGLKAASKTRRLVKTLKSRDANRGDAKAVANTIKIKEYNKNKRLRKQELLENPHFDAIGEKLGVTDRGLLARIINSQRFAAGGQVRADQLRLGDILNSGETVDQKMKVGNKQRRQIQLMLAKDGQSRRERVDLDKMFGVKTRGEKMGPLKFAAGGQVRADQLRLGDILNSGETVDQKMKVGNKQRRQIQLMLAKDGQSRRERVDLDKMFGVKTRGEKMGPLKFAAGGQVRADQLRLGDILNSGETVDQKMKVGNRQRRQIQLMLAKDGQSRRERVDLDKMFGVKTRGKDMSLKLASGGVVQKFAGGGSAQARKNAYIFDFDDTLATTEAKSFKDFSNPDFIESASATRYASLAKRRASQGDDVHVLTARSGSKKIRGAIASFMAKNGIPTKSVMGVGKAFPNEREPGKRPGTTRKLSTASKKQRVLQNLAKRYGEITFLDDNVENILKASQVQNVNAVTAEKKKLFKKFAIGGKVGIFDSDTIEDKTQANAMRKAILDSKKIKNLIWGPAGAGKSTYAKDMYGDKFLKSTDHLGEYDEFIVLSGAQNTKKATKVGGKNVNLSQATVDLIREAKDITAIIPEQELLLSRRQKRIDNPESVRSMGDKRSLGSLKGSMHLANEKQSNEILKTFQGLKSGISVLRPTMANPSGKTIEAPAGAIAATGGRIEGTTGKTKGMTLEEAAASGLKRSQLSSGFPVASVDAFFGGTAAENQAASRKAAGAARKKKGATDSNLTYGAAFLEKVTASASGERSVDVDGKKVLYDFKTAYVDPTDSKKIKDDYVVPQAMKAVNSIAGLFANSVGAKATKSKNIPNLPAITGSLYEAGLARVVGGGIADDADDNRIFDFPAGLRDAAGIFGPDGKALQNVKTDAKVASSSSALKSIRAKVKNDLSKKKFAKGGAAPSDTVPALLTPGEFVFNAESAKKIGYSNLNRMNKQGVQGYAAGGVVSTGMPAGGRATSSRSLYGSATPPDGLRSFNSGVIKGKANSLAKQLDKVARNFELMGLTGGEFTKAMLIARDDLESGSGKMKKAYEKGAAATFKGSGASVLSGPRPGEGRGTINIPPSERVTSFIGGKGDRTKSTQANNLVSGFQQGAAGSAGVDMTKVQKAYREDLKKSGSVMIAEIVARKETERQITEINGIRKREAAEKKKELDERKKTGKITKGLQKVGSELTAAMQKSKAVYSSVKAAPGAIGRGAAGVGNFVTRGKFKGAASADGRSAATDKISGMAGAAQSFVFLGAMLGTTINQLGGFSEATKQAVNETAGFVTGIVGVGGTLVQTITSAVAANAQSAIANQGEALASGSAAVADEAESVASKKAAAANSAAGGKLASVFGIASLAVLAVVATLKFFSAKAKADADLISKTRAKEIEGMKKSGDFSLDTAGLQQGLEEELRLRQESAELGSTSALATAGAYAAAGALAGSFIPGLGTAVGAAIGGIAGGLIGYYKVTNAATDAIDASAKARLREARSTREVYEAQVQLAQSTYDLTSSLSDIESTRGLTDSQKIEKRLEAQQVGAGESIGITRDIKAKTFADAGALGISQSKLSSLDEAGIRAAAGEKDLDVNQTNAIVQRSAVAFKTLEAAANQAALRVSETGKTLGSAMSALEVGDSTSAIKSQQQFAQATAAARAAIQDETATRLAGIDPTLEGDVLKKAQNEINQKGNKKLALFNQGVVAVLKAKKAEVISIARAAKAQIALTRAIERTDEFLNRINNIELNLDRQSEAMDNFAAVIDNAALKVKASGIDEIGDVASVKDINKFAAQVAGVTSKFGPEAKKMGSELAQSASVLKNARSLIGKNFSTGDPIDPKEILNGLGLTSGLVGKDIFDQISSTLRSSKGALKEEDIAAIFGPLKQLGDKNADVIKRLVGVNQKEIDNYQKYLDIKEKLRNREVEQKTKEIEVAREGLKLRQEADALVRKSQGLEEDPVTAARQTRSQNTVARNAKNQAQLQGLTVGGKQVNASNVGQVAAIRANAIRERGQIQKRIAGGDNSKELIKRQKQLQLQITSTTNVLESFADSGEKAQDIFTEMEANISVIEKERQKREQMLAVVEEFVVGGEDARKNLVMASRGIRQAFAVGSLQMQSPEQRQATVGLLDQLSDVVLMGGMTGQQIKQELVVRDAIRMGLDPNIAKQLATATTTEQKLIQANKNLALEIHQLTQETINSRKALADPKPAGGKATGGLVQYRAGGGTIFKPKGTDTVPAMLTPGEFVVRKSAVDKIGAGNLAAMNNGGSTVPGFANGGPVYLHKGGKGGGKNKNYKFHIHYPDGQPYSDSNVRSAHNLAEAENWHIINDGRTGQSASGARPNTVPSAAKPQNSGGGRGTIGSAIASGTIQRGTDFGLGFGGDYGGGVDPNRFPVGPGGVPVRGVAEAESHFKQREKEFSGKSSQMPNALDLPYNIGKALYHTPGFLKSLFSSGEPAAKPASTAPAAPTIPQGPMFLDEPYDMQPSDTISPRRGFDHFGGIRKLADTSLSRVPKPPSAQMSSAPRAVPAEARRRSTEMPTVANFQKFTDNTGEFSVQARITGVNRTGTQVTMQTADGRTITVPMNRLSKQSKALGTEWWNSQGSSQFKSKYGRDFKHADMSSLGTLSTERDPKTGLFPPKRYAKGGPVYRAFGGGIGYGGGGYGPGNTGQMQAARGNQYMMQQYQQGNQFMNQRRQDGMNFMNNMRNEALSYSVRPGMTYTGGGSSRQRNLRGKIPIYNILGGAGLGVSDEPDTKLTTQYNRILQQRGETVANKWLFGPPMKGTTQAPQAHGVGPPAPAAAAAGARNAQQSMRVVKWLARQQRNGHPLRDAVNELNGRSPNSPPVTNQEKRYAKQMYKNSFLGQGPQNAGGVQPLARGGVVPSYFNSGGMNQDTVPAMLTPGEFVMSQDAVKKHGIAAMKSLNQGQVPGFNRGGVVGGVQYRQEGGILGNIVGGAAKMMGLDTSEMGSLFDNFVGSFSKTLDNLTNPLTLLAASMNNLADKFGNFTMTHKVEISGLPDIDANLLGNQLGESIANKTVDQVQRRLDDNNNQFQGLA